MKLQDLRQTSACQYLQPQETTFRTERHVFPEKVVTEQGSFEYCKTIKLFSGLQARWSYILSSFNNRIE